MYCRQHNDCYKCGVEYRAPKHVMPQAESGVRRMLPLHDEVLAAYSTNCGIQCETKINKFIYYFNLFIISDRSTRNLNSSLSALLYSPREPTYPLPNTYQISTFVFCQKLFSQPLSNERV